jgi:type IV pilus assembly protein PilA
MEKNRKGFTLVEIMIVTAIIGILAMIAIPNFLLSRKESQKNACIANLKQIEGACEQAKLAGAAVNDLSDLCSDGSAGFLKVQPICKAGGTYALPTDGSVGADGNVTPGTRATCTLGASDGHVLP